LLHIVSRETFGLCYSCSHLRDALKHLHYSLDKIMGI